MRPYRLGILGATGLVGQRLVRLLEAHPWFRVAVLAASERSADREYGEAVDWQLAGEIPDYAKPLIVRAAEPSSFQDCDVVLSALDADPARTIEPELARAGFAVISNSSAFRQDPAVPLLVPEVNQGHLELLEARRGRWGDGYIVTNPNCSATGLALAVAPIHRAFGVRRLVVTTLQAISGAGAVGPRALDLTDNVIPFIRGEEEKIESELVKILGVFRAGEISPSNIAVSAHCHRVGTLDGHLEAVSLETERDAGVNDVRRVLESFRSDTRELDLPSEPERTILVRDEPDRPQPRLDRDSGGGMTTVVGRIRACPVLGVKLELLSHNTVRGAAGGTLLNAELLARKDLLPRRDRR